MYLRRLSWPGSDGCCGFFGLFDCVLKVVLPDVSPLSSADVYGFQSLPVQCNIMLAGVVQYFSILK